MAQGSFAGISAPKAGWGWSAACIALSAHLSMQLPYEAMADSVGLQTQGPWVYSQRLDEDKHVQFLATTRARMQRSIW